MLWGRHVLDNLWWSYEPRRICRSKEALEKNNWSRKWKGGGLERFILLIYVILWLQDVLILEYDFKLITATKTAAPSLRFGDVNLDGYNDLLMTVIEKGKEDSYSYFFENMPCDLAECKALSSSHSRYFKMRGSDTSYALI